MAYESELALHLTPYTAGEQPQNPHLIKLNTFIHLTILFSF